MDLYAEPEDEPLRHPADRDDLLSDVCGVELRSGTWYESIPDPVKREVVYKVVREFDILSAKEVI